MKRIGFAYNEKPSEEEEDPPSSESQDRFAEWDDPDTINAVAEALVDDEPCLDPHVLQVTLSLLAHLLWHTNQQTITALHQDHTRGAGIYKAKIFMDRLCSGFYDRPS